jgi:hypothetical protein
VKGHDEPGKVGDLVVELENAAIAGQHSIIYVLLHLRVQYAGHAVVKSSRPLQDGIMGIVEQ